jgi:hypothetical protein
MKWKTGFKTCFQMRNLYRYNAAATVATAAFTGLDGGALHVESS